MELANLRAFTRGKSLYTLLRANSLYENDSTNFFSGIDFFRDPSVAMLAPLRKELDQLRDGMPVDSMLQIASSVQTACDSIDRQPSLSLLARRMLAHWKEECGHLGEIACGANASWQIRDSVLIPGQEADCDLTVSIEHATAIGVRWEFLLPTGWRMEQNPDAAPRLTSHSDERLYRLTVGDDAQPTLPKTVTQYRGLENRHEVAARVTVVVNGNPLVLDVRPRFEIAPRQLIAVEPPRAAILRSRLGEGVRLRYTIQNFLPHKTAGRIGMSAPHGWRGENEPFVIGHEDSTAAGEIAGVSCW